MNDLQIKVMHYLSEPGGSRERKTALQSLVGRGVFSGSQTENDTRRVINNYLKTNPAGLCNEGVARFRAAMDINDPTVPVTDRVTYLVTVDVARSGEGPVPYLTSGMLARSIGRVVRGLPQWTRGNGDTRSIKDVHVQVTNYNYDV